MFFPFLISFVPTRIVRVSVSASAWEFCGFLTYVLSSSRVYVGGDNVWVIVCEDVSVGFSSLLFESANMRFCVFFGSASCGVDRLFVAEDELWARAICTIRFSISRERAWLFSFWSFSLVHVMLLRSTW